MPHPLVVTAPGGPDARAVVERVERAAARVAPDLEVVVRSGVVDASPAAGDVDLGGCSPPPAWLIETAVLRHLAPAHLLFLCVANSARSQLAEGIARSIAPAGVRISSAGSAPGAVRPQAVAVLAEIGIDASGQRPKGIGEVQRPVDAVVTLCAEEVCPVWLEAAWRVHWALPDPAGAGSAPAEEMAAFRVVRDELVRRLGVLFGARGRGR